MQHKNNSKMDYIGFVLQRNTFTEWRFNIMSSVFIEDFKKHSHKGYRCVFCKHGHCDIVHYVIHHPVYRGPGNKFPLEFMREKSALLNKEEASFEQPQ